MATINIDYVLSGSTVGQTFTATGTYDPVGTTNPPPATFSMQHGGTSEPSASPSFNTGARTWSAQFSGLTTGSSRTLHAAISGTAATDDEPSITVIGSTDPDVTIDPLPVPPPVPPGPERLVPYTVTGTYQKKGRGVGIICVAVTRAGKKIQSVDAAAAADLRGNGTWTATLEVNVVGSGQKLTIIAIMIDDDGAPVARAGRMSPKKT